MSKTREIDNLLVDLLSGHDVTEQHLYHAKLLVQQGANINWQSSGEDYRNTILHGALVNEARFVAKRLVEEFHAVIDFLAQDSEGKTALLMAVKVLNLDMVKLILKFEKNEKRAKNSIDLSDNQGRTPLHYAYLLGQTEMVKALLRAGANPERKDKHGFNPRHYLKATEELVIETLNSVTIDANRSQYALSNIFGSRCYGEVDEVNPALLPPYLQTSSFIANDHKRHYGLLLNQQNLRHLIARAPLPPYAAQVAKVILGKGGEITVLQKCENEKKEMLAQLIPSEFTKVTASRRPVPLLLPTSKIMLFDVRKNLTERLDLQTDANHQVRYGQ